MLKKAGIRPQQFDGDEGGVRGAHLSSGEVLSHKDPLEACSMQPAAQHHILRYLVYCEQLPMVLPVGTGLCIRVRKLAHLERCASPDHHVGPCSHIFSLLPYCTRETVAERIE